MAGLRGPRAAMLVGASVGVRALRVAVALADAMAGCCPDALYEITTAAPVVRLPQDEAPHCFGGVEWWYYSGRIVTDDGRGFGVVAVIFHLPQWPHLVAGDEWIAHLAVLDQATSEFTYEQSHALEAAKVSICATSGFELETALVQMAGGGGHDHVRAAMASGRYALDLTVEDERGPILHGVNGYVPEGVRGRSFYYSRPRMQASGTFAVNGETHTASGALWFDRQWGLDLTNPRLPWDWFSVRLDDGTNLMLYRFRDSDPPVMLGTYIPASGEPLTLTADQIAITPTASWTSPHSGTTYPVAWDMQVGVDGLTLHVSAVADDQEFDARATTDNIYWEGLCSVTATADGRGSITGYAYAELTNYAVP